MLSENEKQRYSRQLILPHFSETEQIKLKNANVLVVGAGGLGGVVLNYLVRMGIGYIGIVDFDVVDWSNLHRQLLYTSEDIGKSKSDLACARLVEMNPNVHIEVYNECLNQDNINSIAENYSIIMDCTDNFEVRYLINDYAHIHQKPVIFGSVGEFTGQVTVFNVNKNKNYRDLYPEMPIGEPKKGILPTLLPIIGGLQANELIKLVSGIGTLLDGKLLVYNVLECSQYIVEF